MDTCHRHPNTPPPPSTTEHTLFSLLCLDGQSELNKLRSAFLGHASLLDIYMFPCSMRIVIFFLFSIHMQGLVIKLSHLTPECEIQFKVCHTKILMETFFSFFWTGGVICMHEWFQFLVCDLIWKTQRSSSDLHLTGFQR